eukprot:4019024-Amphidinium_carterae.1
MEAFFGDPDGEDHPALNFERITEDVESLEAFTHFSKMLPPEYNRQAIASFAKCAKTLSEGEAMLLVSAFKRPQGIGAA